MIKMNSRVEAIVYRWKFIDNLVCLESSEGDYILNDIASRIWKMFDGYTTFGAIIKCIMEEEGEEDMDEAKLVISEYIEGLEAKGFVTIIEDNPEEDW